MYLLRSTVRLRIDSPKINWSSKMRIGSKRFVYIIECQQYIKVGVSDKPFERLGSMATGNPFELKLLALLFISGSRQAYATENKIHKKFSKFRVRGEWFERGILEDVLDMMITPITDINIMENHCKSADDYHAYNGNVDLSYAYDMGYRSGLEGKSVSNPFKGIDTSKSMEWKRGRREGKSAG